MFLRLIVVLALVQMQYQQGGYAARPAAWDREATSPQGGYSERKQKSGGNGCLGAW